MINYEILMKNGEKVRVSMTDNLPSLIKQFAESVHKNGSDTMVFDDSLVIRCADVSAIRKTTSQ